MCVGVGHPLGHGKSSGGCISKGNDALSPVAITCQKLLRKGRGLKVTSPTCVTTLVSFILSRPCADGHSWHKLVRTIIVFLLEVRLLGAPHHHLDIPILSISLSMDSIFISTSCVIAAIAFFFFYNLDFSSFGLALGSRISGSHGIVAFNFLRNFLLCTSSLHTLRHFESPLQKESDDMRGFWGLRTFALAFRLGFDL